MTALFYLVNIIIILQYSKQKLRKGLFMFSKLVVPDQYFDTIYDIDLIWLYKRGYRNLLLDIDNTITPWNSDEISEKLKQWVKHAHHIGFSIYLFSNSHKTRILKVARSLNVKAIPCRGKPLISAFKKAIKFIGGAPENTVMIGDQIFTDILGGNRLNLYTILIKPISSKEFVGTKINRWLEKKLIGRR